MATSSSSSWWCALGSSSPATFRLMQVSQISVNVCRCGTVSEDTTNSFRARSMTFSSVSVFEHSLM